MKITEALLAEHVVYHSLFDHLERVVPRAQSTDEVRVQAQVLEAMLEHHSEVEDELLIEPLEHHLDQMGQRETFHAEHAAIDRCLQHLRASTSLDDARRLLGEAVQLCREHFDKEERLIFPMAERALSERTLLELGQRWEERRQIAMGK